jgi:UDP-2,4-diacetamido-2,4,6-trideoxy-beta-L-altropyranose hydrolase
MGRPGSLTTGDNERAQVTLRPATDRDAGLLIEWRNDPDAIRFSVTGRGVTPDEHRHWLSARLADPSTRLWIAEQGGTPVGQVRVDMAAGTGTVSVGIAPAHRGRGIGSAVLQAMVIEIERETVARELRAIVNADNPASIRAFERAGFHRGGRDEPGFLVLERSVGAEK